jgi:hypothetical protein
MPATIARYSRPAIFSEESSAPRRRLAAGRATEQLPGSAVAVSRALAGRLTAEPSWWPSAACAAPHRNTVRRPAGRRLVVGPSCPEPAVPWSPCPHPWSASKCPVSGPGVQCPRMRCPRVRCPMSGCPVSGCGRPASRVGVRAFRVGVRGVRTGDLVEHVGAARPHGQEGLGLAALPYPRTARAAARARAGASEPARAVLGQRRRRAGPGRRRGRRSGSGPGSTTWPARDTLVARQDRPPVEEQRPRAVYPIGGMALQVDRAMLAGIRPTMTWAEPVATTIGARCDRPGPRVARSGRYLTRRCGRAHGPGAAQASSERHQPSRVSPLS